MAPRAALSVEDTARHRNHRGIVSPPRARCNAEPEQLDEVVRTIEVRGVKKVSEPRRREIGRDLFIEDPDGYTVEIFEGPTPLHA